MRRRDFIAIAGGALVSLPCGASGQQLDVRTIGYLGSTSPLAEDVQLNAFRRSLSDAGFIEGKNLSIEFRWADNMLERLPALAAELVSRKVAVIVASGNTPAQVAKATTTTIPIVFAAGADPVQLGLAPGLNGVRGNLTGVSRMSLDLGSKRFELLRGIISDVAKIGLIVNQKIALANIQIEQIQQAAHLRGLHTQVFLANTESEIDTAFSTFSETRVAAVLIINDNLFTSQRTQLVSLAARHAKPTMYSRSDYVVAGGLISYGPSVADAHWHVGDYTARILKGEKPEDLPIQQSMKFELVINLKTARTLNIEITPSILALADEVIE